AGGDGPPDGSPRDRRSDGDGRGSAPAACGGVRGMQVEHRPAQEIGADMEEGARHGRHVLDRRRHGETGGLSQAGYRCVSRKTHRKIRTNGASYAESTEFVTGAQSLTRATDRPSRIGIT